MAVETFSIVAIEKSFSLTTKDEKLSSHSLKSVWKNNVHRAFNILFESLRSFARLFFHV